MCTPSSTQEVAGRATSHSPAACPGFVEFVERGQNDGRRGHRARRTAACSGHAADVDTLLLGCTHYPFLSRVIGDVVGESRHAGELGRRDRRSALSESRRTRLLRHDHVQRRQPPVPVERRCATVPRARSPSAGPELYAPGQPGGPDIPHLREQRTAWPALTDTDDLMTQDAPTDTSCVVSFERDHTEMADGSCFVSFGRTRCSAPRASTTRASLDARTGKGG